MKFLLDTNIFLEVILDQAKAEESKALLSNDAHELFVTDFSIHSIGVFLFRRNQHKAFAQLIEDTLLNGRTTAVGLQAEDMNAVVNSAERFLLDFDDAYQYVAAEKNLLTLVSFDSDFDKTDRGRVSPSQALAGT